MTTMIFSNTQQSIAVNTLAALNRQECTPSSSRNLLWSCREKSSQSAEDESECDLEEARDLSEVEIAAMKRAEKSKKAFHGGKRHALPTALLLGIYLRC